MKSTPYCPELRQRSSVCRGPQPFRRPCTARGYSSHHLLVLERAVDHADVAAAVDVVRGVGRNADHASLAGRGDDHQLAKLDVAAALRDHTHAAAVVEVDVADGNAPAVGERGPGVVTRSRAEYHHVADRGGQVFAQNADVAVGAFFGRDRPVRQPVVRGTERRFAPHGVELPAGWRRSTFVPLGIAETQAAVDDVAEVIFGELDFQPTVALRHNGALGIERTGEVDRQVAHR